MSTILWQCTLLVIFFCFPTGKSGYWEKDRISHSITLSWHWASYPVTYSVTLCWHWAIQSLPYSINAKHQTRKRRVSILQLIGLTRQGTKFPISRKPGCALPIRPPHPVHVKGSHHAWVMRQESIITAILWKPVFDRVKDILSAVYSARYLANSIISTSRKFPPLKSDSLQ